MIAKQKPKSSERTLYQVLDLAPGETAATVHIRYRELALRHHPDRKGGDHDLFCAVTAAGSILLDEARRREYDLKLRLTRTPCKKCAGDGRMFIQVSFVERVTRRCHICKGVGYE